MRQILYFLFLLFSSSVVLADYCLDVFPTNISVNHSKSLTPIATGVYPYSLGNNAELELETDVTYATGAAAFGNNVEIEVDDDNGGSVRWHFNGGLNISNYAEINEDGSPSALIIYVNGNVNIASNAKINAIIYSTASVTLNNNSTFNGAISAAGSVLVGNNVSVNYSASYINNANFNGMCSPGGGATVPVARAEWRFDETSWSGVAGEIVDSVGGYHGTAAGNAQSGADGVVCRQADLSETGITDFLSLDGDALNGLQDFSISLWLKSASWSPSALISGANSGQANELILYLNGSARVEPWIRNYLYSALSIPTLADQQWHHMVWVRSGSYNCIYVDKTGYGCVSNMPTVPLFIAENGLIIGQEQDSLAGGFDQGQDFRGQLDELVLFDQALSAAQVELIYNNQLAGKGYDSSDRNCPVATALIGEWRFEESNWQADQLEGVLDSSGNDLHGVLRFVGTTEKSSPAIDGNPGSCRYGDFNGNDLMDLDGKGYIEVPDNPLLDISDEVTVTAWIRPNRYPAANLDSIVSKDGDYEFHLNTQGQLYWYWEPASGGSKTLTTSASVPINSWSHVAIAYRSGEQRIYINGVQQGLTNGNDQGSETGSLSGNDFPLYIGSDQNYHPLRDFSGDIDEVRVYRGALDGSEIQNIMAETHPCDFGDLARLELTAASTGSTCSPFNLSVTAYDSDDSVLTDYDGTISLSTSTGHGNWGGNSADLPAGTLNPNPDSDDNGQVAYQFAVADQGSVSLQLSNSHADQLTITATDQQESISVTSPAIQFSDNVLVVSSIDSLGSDIVAGRDHSFNVALQKRDSNSGNCGIATEYSGALTLHGWLERSGNDPGSSLSPVLAHSGNGTQISANSSASAVTTTMTFNSGEAQFHWQTSDVGQYTLQLEDRLSGFIKDSLGNSVTISSSSDQWTVRPFGVHVSAEGNPAGQDHNGAVYRRAGEAFNVTVNGVLYQNQDDQDNDGYPDGHGDETLDIFATNNDRDPANNVDLSDNSTAVSYNIAQNLAGYLVDPTGGHDPGLSGALSVTPAVAESYIFNDVGVLELVSGVSSYLGSGRSVFGRSGYVGRFKAASFAVSVEEQGELSNACSGFTYVGQQNGSEGAITYAAMAEPVLRIEPLGMTGELLRNYTGQYRKLAVGDVALNPPLADSTALGLDQSTAIQISAVMSAGSLSETTNGSGYSGPMLYRLSSDDHYQYIKEQNSRVAAFNSDLRIDVGGVTESAEATLPASASGALPALIPQAIELRYGRMRLDNVYGPEAPDGDPLMLMMVTEYLSSSGMLVNQADSCTPYLAENMSMRDYQDNLESGETSVSGGGTLSAGQPVAAEQLWLSLPGEGNSGSVTLEYDAPSWLQDDWSGDGSLQDPEASAHFGQHRGSDRVIFWREITQ